MEASLTRRALNRATLDRQLLLDRSPMPVLDAVERLVGLQAQTPHSWYVGLWSRLAGFRPEHAADLLTDRTLVRMVLMRSTIHLVSATDALELRALTQIVSERGIRSNYGKDLAGLDRAELTAAGRALVDAEPLTFAELGRRLAERWPDRAPGSLAQAIRAWVPLVQVPPRGLWGVSGPVAHMSVQGWLRREPAADPSLEGMVRRYLAAFGPATVRDVQTWSGLTRLGEVVDRLRPELRTFADEDGRELFDLPEAPRPDPDTPAPVRFLYDFDNLLLSHADRRRVVTDAMREQDFGKNVQPSVVLIDGHTHASWKLVRERGTTVLTVRPLIPLSARERTAITEEGAGLLEFHAPGAHHDLRILPAPS